MSDVMEAGCCGAQYEPGPVTPPAGSLTRPADTLPSVLGHTPCRAARSARPARGSSHNYAQAGLCTLGNGFRRFTSIKIFLILLKTLLLWAECDTPSVYRPARCGRELLSWKRSWGGVRGGAGREPGQGHCLGLSASLAWPHWAAAAKLKIFTEFQIILSQLQRTLHAACLTAIHNMQSSIIYIISCTTLPWSMSMTVSRQ